MTKEEFIYILETRLPELSEIIETKPTKIKYKGTERTSGWSRQFIIPNGEAVGRYLQRIFGIDCPDWDLKYQQAVSGSGQEKDKITTLHSSSLLALLCFSNVSKYNCLKINGIEYDQVWFEVKNKVFDKPSNIDVVLGNSKTQDLLFLESKFTEYLSADNSAFAAKYLDFYKSILPEIEKQPLQMVFPCKYKGSKGMGLQPSSKSEILKSSFIWMALNNVSPILSVFVRGLIIIPYSIGVIIKVKFGLALFFTVSAENLSTHIMNFTHKPLQKLMPAN